MAYSRLWAHDGNNSLKRVLPFGNRNAADVRVFEHSRYFLPRSFVDRFANEVKPNPNRHREIRSSGLDSGSEDEDDSEPGLVDTDRGGDPTDGVHDTATSSVGHCVKNWKAAAADEKKRTWAIFDETGIYASACRHGFILWICDMVRSGELLVTIRYIPFFIELFSIGPNTLSLSLRRPWRFFHRSLRVVWTSIVASKLPPHAQVWQSKYTNNLTSSL